MSSARPTATSTPVDTTVEIGSSSRGKKTFEIIDALASTEPEPLLTDVAKKLHPR